jgi:hypothetical protein
LTCEFYAEGRAKAKLREARQNLNDAEEEKRNKLAEQSSACIDEDKSNGQIQKFTKGKTFASGSRSDICRQNNEQEKIVSTSS